MGSTRFSFRWLALCLIVVAHLPQQMSSYAQTKRYIFEHYTTKEGLSSNDIVSLFKDSRGYLWICTLNGLTRYDGYEFKKYFYDIHDSASLPASYVSAIAEDKNGMLWMGCWGGLAKYNPVMDKFTRMPFPYYNKIECLLYDTKDRLWATTLHGITIFDTTGKIIKRWEENYPWAHGVTHICQDKQGNIWLLSLNGLALFHESDMSFSLYKNNHPAYTKGNEYINAVGYHMTEDKNGILWTSGWANGIKRFDPGTGDFYSWLPSPEFAGDGGRNVITSEAFFDNQLWVASHDMGLGTFDTATKQFYFFSSLMSSDIDYAKMNYYDYFGLPVNRTKCLLSTGNCLWIAADNGLWKLDLREQLVSLYKLRSLRTGGCAPDITSIAQVPKTQNEFYVPTISCGIFKYNINTGEAAHIDNPLIDKQYAMHRQNFFAVFTHPNGSVWAAASCGLFRLQNDKTQLIQLLPGNKNMPDENYFFCTVMDADSNLWAGSGTGLMYFRKGEGEGRFYSIHDMAAGMEERISAVTKQISIAPNGDLWILRWGKTDNDHCSVTIFRKKTGVFETWLLGETGPFNNFPFPKAATDILVDRSGKLWFATERGLVMYSAENNPNFKIFTSREGLICDDLNSVSEDTYGRIWVSAHEGLSCIDTANFSLQSLRTGNSLPWLQVTSVTPGNNGKLYIGYNHEWLGIYDPQLHLKDSTHYSCTVVSVELDNRSLIPSDKLQVEYDFNMLRIKFSPLNFLSPDENKYHIVIKGPKSTSRYTTSNNELSLTDLSPGKYELEISISSNLLKYETNMTRISIDVLPPYYQTWWFYSLEVCLFLGISLAIIRLYTTRKLAKQKAEFEKQQAIVLERTRIASDMHDELGAGLTSIRLLSEIANKKMKNEKPLNAEIEKIERAAIRLSENLREIIWMMNVSQNNIKDFIIYSKVYAVDYFENTEMNFQCVIPFEIPELVMDGEMRRAIFLCIKEALNNIVKHSQATKASISFEFIADNLVIDIKDNGIGIVINNENIFGNGLLNMKRKINNFKGTLDILVDNGTKLSITLPIHMFYK